MAWQRVLIVDDDRDTVDYIGYFLGKASLSVVMARNGEEGFRLAMAQRPDLIVCDIRMPGGMDGFEFARKIRNEIKLKTVPMVALTGAEATGDEQRAIDAGFDAFLLKPMNPWKLADQLKAFIK
jgi:two-component system cell cycle response regulator DivK